MGDYDPGRYTRFPHTRYRCPECNETAIAVGWEVETLVCDDCLLAMEWDTEMYDPR